MERVRHSILPRRFAVSVQKASATYIDFGSESATTFPASVPDLLGSITAKGSTIRFLNCLVGAGNRATTVSSKLKGVVVWAATNVIVALNQTG